VENKKEVPLVSIIVVTYNSSEFVLETLESIKSQTYNNIELIITDDCSQDNTVEICAKWLEKNNKLFTNTSLISALENKGIPANCQQGFDVTKGVWIKFIAGDDILADSCIEDFMAYSHENSQGNIIESQSQFFKNSFKKENFYHIQNLGNEYFFKETTSGYEQYNLLLRRNYLHAPSVIVKRDCIVNAGGFDLRYRWIEDHPLWLRITKEGNKIHFMNNITVFYRVHNSSVFGSIGTTKLYNDFYKKRKDFDEEYIYPNLSKLELFCKKYEYNRKLLLDNVGLNKNNIPCKIINKITFLLNPQYIVAGYLKLVKKRYINE